MNKVRVALVGQPNVGKSSLLNAISGAKVRVGNFPGVTVEKASGTLKSGNTIIEVIDLPGTYSLSAYSQEEKVTRAFLESGEYDLIVQVIESANLERNLSLTAELMHLNKPALVALNMMDEARSEGIEIDAKQLSEILGLPAIKVSARTGEGLNTLVARMADAHKFPVGASKLIYSDTIEEGADKIAAFLKSCGEDAAVLGKRDARMIALDLMAQKPETYHLIHDHPLLSRLQPVINEALEALYLRYNTRDLHEIFLLEHRAFARGAALEVVRRHVPPLKEALTERIDRVLLHPVLGIPIFLFFMWGLFQMTFTLGEIPMGWLEALFGAMAEGVRTAVTHEGAAGLLADGIIGGVGAVLMFLPNIMILFLGIALLETTGYMARAAFLLDGFLHRFGLHGKSFVPLVSGFGCSVPAFMAARTLKNDRDRLVTLFIINFMSCGARLPVYVLFIGAFFPAAMAGNVLFGIYILGALVGLIMAKVLRTFFLKGPDEPFVMEMPRYRLPSLLLVWTVVWGKAVMYMKKAGTFILAAAVLIWFASNYPAYDNPNLEGAALAEAQMENSYLGKAGMAIEPVFAPLDFDWRMGVALVSGLAAKEVVVSTMGVLYSVGDDVTEESQTLIETLQANISLPSAIAFVMFVMFYNPCLAATVVFRQEAGGSKYVAYLFVFTTIVAYAMALIGFTIAAWVA
ncbi:MAG: ferrous iron transport protein B [Campylobacterales bacterium]